MTRHVVRRAAAGLVVLAATVLLTYWLFLAGPFDPARTMCGERCTPDRLADIEATLGTDSSVGDQFVGYLEGLVVGRDIPLGSTTVHCPAPCLGLSYDRRALVTDLVVGRLPVTASIAVGAAVASLVLGTGLGAVAARRRGTWVDRAVLGATMTLSAVPFYVVAIMAYLVFVVRFGLFSRDGYHPLLGPGPWYDDVGAWARALLPAWLMLGLFGAAGYARYTRGLVLDALGEDYVRTAVATGLSPGRVLRRHALRTAYAPLVTIFSLELAGLLSGAIFVEQIFGLQGLGYLAFDSIGRRDLPVLVGTTLFGAFLIVAGNLLADVVQARLDPRVRFR